LSSPNRRMISMESAKKVVCGKTAGTAPAPDQAERQLEESG
jgi:hypothetical protein